MATTIGLGVQFTANANGMTKGLSDADRAIRNLAQQASSAAKLFDTFASSSAAAAQTQQQVATDVAFLGSAFRTGQISAEQYAEELRAIVSSANGAAQAFAEGAQVTERVATAEEKRAATLARLAQLLEQGAISQQTYERAAADASGANESAAKAETARAQALARAAQITQANLSPAQKYDQEVQELNQHLQAGRISQETYNTALQKAAQQFAKAEVAAAKYDAAADNAGTGNVLAFNELSGILAAIPGPIGNVAGRISGLASAGEGLGRVFAGGLSQGFGSLASSAAAIVNPLTVGVAALAGSGAAASAVASGLIELEGRVEKLGNLADQLGVSFGFIQTLEEAAARSGVSVESLAGAMTRLQKTLAGADEESKSAQKALADLGLSVEQLNGLSQEDQIRLIGQRLAAIEDPAKRTAAAMALFGRSGAELLPLFNNLGSAASDMERLGAALSDLDRSRIDDFGAGLDALGVASRGLGQQLLLPFAGLGEGLAQGAAEFISGITAIVAPIGDVLEPAFTGLGRVFELFGNGLGAIGKTIGAVLQPLGTIIQGIFQAIEPLNQGFLDFLKSVQDSSVAVTEWIVSFSPMGAIANNISTVTDAIGEAVEMIERIATVVSTAFSQFLGVVQNTVSGVVSYIGSAVSSFAEFVGLSDVIAAFASAVTSAFNGIWEGIKNVVSSVGGFIERVVSFAERWLGIKREVEVPAEAVIEVREPALSSTQYYKEIDEASKKAAEFGQAGFDAALRYQEGLEQIAQMQADGTLTAEEAKRAAEEESKVYEQRIDILEREADARKKAADAAKQAAEEAAKADKKVADDAIGRQRVENEFGGDSQRAQAAENVLAIEREIIRVEEELRAAREAGDQAAADAAARRLAQLDQAAQREREIADGTARQREEADRKAQRAVEDRKRAEEQKAKTVADLEERLLERVVDIERDRLDALSRQSNESLAGNDLRTSAGASQFLALATGREDPAIEEYRKQLRELENIRREIASAKATPVELPG